LHTRRIPQALQLPDGERTPGRRRSGGSRSAPIATLCLVLFALAAQFAQADAGELRIFVNDPSGAALTASVTVENSAGQVRRSVDTDTVGRATVRRLPFGAYRVTVAHDGFAPASAVVEIRSAVPTEYRVTLAVASLASTVDVGPDTTLIDTRQTTTERRVGAETIQRRAAPLPGRAVPELINTQPGWLLEANGIVHPRGSENQTQYVVDGLPLTDNRSPGFAPELDADSIHSLGILTGGYPAEYGRKLGGVIEVATVEEARHGLHGDVTAGGGSFGTAGADATIGYAGQKASLVGGAGGSRTDRYLDPPVEENYTNHGSTAQAGVHLEAGGFGVMINHAASRFMVPNDEAQQDAGQVQRRTSAETAARLSYQRVVTRSALFSVNGMVRDLGATLASNELSTPIAAEQDRGISDGYVKATIAWHAGAHDWKAGADTSYGHVREQFGYRITDPSAFDDDVAPHFAFADRATDREHALFIQDQISAGHWTIKAGLRWDAYHLVVDESAFSPRLAIAWSPGPGFVLRASYDRAYQTPAVENLLLASSPDVEAISDSVLRLPVRPSRGNFGEVAMAAALASRLRLDVNAFDRRMRDFADDDLLLNTGVSFPIAFGHGFVHGAELKLEVPPGRGDVAGGGLRGALSGFLSYTWMRGEAELPVTGGLFLGDEADLGDAGDRIPISQDQRHTLRGRVAAQLTPQAWLAFAGAFDSGLPFEDAGDTSDLSGTVSPRVLAQVDLDAGRVRPASTFDVSAGWMVLKTGKGRIELQADLRNVTDRLRVINFAGAFSGTALAAPRAVAARVRVEF
jgi:outer membrane receptor protein involved in Fe transport